MPRNSFVIVMPESRLNELGWLGENKNTLFSEFQSYLQGKKE